MRAGVVIPRQMPVAIRRVTDDLWEIPRGGAMRVPGRVFASKELIDKATADRALDQVVNVAHLPEIVGYSYAMPDVHWGYGFPIGGGWATDVAAGGGGPARGGGIGLACRRA